MNDVITLVEDLAGRKASVKRIGRHEGDVTHTGADVERARRDLGFAPKVDLRTGLARELEFIEQVILSCPQQ
jgi:UDP-glucose 4-epimerase